MLGEYRFGVELHAPMWQTIDLEGLDGTVLAAGVHGDTGAGSMCSE